MGFITNFTNEYPYTDFHELNLDWLLTTYQKIVDDINNLNEWMATHKEEYEDALRRLRIVEGEIDTFEAQVQAEFDRLKTEQEQAFAEQTAKLDASIEAMDAKVDAKILQFQNEFNIALNQFRTDFANLERAVEAEIAQLKVEINRAIINLNNQLTANNEYVFEYVENRLDDFINHFPDIANTPVYNPVRGETTGLQKALNDLYDLARYYGLTANQYDYLGLTAQEYDDKELTALDYDIYGYIKLGYPDENWCMISPFTGQYVKVKEVVMDLAHFHMDGLSATEYDALELTAQEYDDKQITAFDYDWFGKDILVA